jgi:hypothetical protein
MIPKGGIRFSEKIMRMLRSVKRGMRAPQPD